MTNDLVEKVARKMQRSEDPGLPWHLEREDEQAFYIRLAQVAAETILAALQEPTEGMIKAYFDKCRELGFTSHINATAAWSALLSASPLGEKEG